jgi:hypothetical protein
MKKYRFTFNLFKFNGLGNEVLIFLICTSLYKSKIEIWHRSCNSV